MGRKKLRLVDIPVGVEDCYALTGGRVRIPIRLKFDGEANVNAETVGESLIALNQIVRRSSGLFGAAGGIPRSRKPRCHVSVDEMGSGSLSERLFIDILLGGDEAARNLIATYGAKAASFSPEAVPYVAAGIVGSLLTLGGIYAIKKFRKSTQAAPMITAHNSIVIASAGKLNISEGAFRKILDTAKGLPLLSRNSVRTLLPGKLAGGTGLQLGSGGDAMRIPAEAIAELPVPSEMKEDSTEKTVALNHVELRIIASDMEHAEHGWAAYLPDDHPFSGVRIRVELAGTATPSRLMYKERIVCDGELVLTHAKAAGSFKPKKIVIDAID